MVIVRNLLVLHIQTINIVSVSTGPTVQTHSKILK